MSPAGESDKTTKSTAKKEEKGGALQAGKDILFLSALGAVILWNTLYFPTMDNWASPASIFFLELIGLAVVGRMFGVCEPTQFLELFSRKSK